MKDKKRINDLLSKDQLKDAIDLLLSEKTIASISLQSLKGRLVDLTKQKNQGTINQEAYNVERNRIRAALINILDGGEEGHIAASKPANWKLFALLGAALVVIAGLIYASQSGIRKGSVHKNISPAEMQNPTVEERAGETRGSTTTKKARINENTASRIQAALRKQNIQYTLDPIALSQSRDYAQFLATMTRRYTWEVAIPVTVATKDIVVKYRAETNTLLVRVSKIQLSSRFSIDNKTSTTTKNNLWIEESSKDGSFWEKVNSFTKSKLAKLIKSDRKLQSKIRNQSISLVIKEINEQLEAQKLEESQVEVVIQKMGF